MYLKKNKPSTYIYNDIVYIQYSVYSFSCIYINMLCLFCNHNKRKHKIKLNELSIYTIYYFIVKSQIEKVRIK
jgi:hypothetical protein